jgi:hypothetical protein
MVSVAMVIVSPVKVADQAARSRPTILPEIADVTRRAQWPYPQIQEGAPH